jgi:two-component system response regulator FlrC
VLQERQVERLGSNKVTELDVRVIATTNRDLRAEVDAGRFREDLFYRLNVFPIRIPSLRERPQDIVPLAEFLLARSAGRDGGAVPVLTDSAREQLLRHDWPGNVRELDNVMQRALIVQDGGRIDAKDIRFEQRSHPAPTPVARAEAVVAVVEPASAEEPEETLAGDLRDRERRIIIEALDECRGSRKSAAARLGISERTLRYKLARMREDGVAVPMR